MVEKKRNRRCAPYISSEGTFVHPLVCPEGDTWYRKMKPCDRMFNHHTLASARKYCHFKPNKTIIPNDELDFILDSTYNHSTEIFTDYQDPYIQPESLGKTTWRRLRNTYDIKPTRHVQEVFAGEATGGKFLTAGLYVTPKQPPEVIPYKYHHSHPVLIGGVKDRVHPSYVKLMNSSHHAPQTNAGYSRQDADGTYFQY